MMGTHFTLNYLIYCFVVDLSQDQGPIDPCKDISSLLRN